MLYPTDYWAVHDAASRQVFETFVTGMEKFLGVERTRINLSEIWKHARSDGMDESLVKAFHHAFDWSANRDQWTGLLQPFIQAYEDAMGKPPVLNPQVRFKVWVYRLVSISRLAETFELII